MNLLVRSVWLSALFAIAACSSAPKTPQQVAEPVLAPAARTAPAVLRVFSKATGREFAHGVEVVVSDRLIRPPDDAVRIGRDLSSPLELSELLAQAPKLPDGESIRTWWLRAPGYAWTRFEYDESTAGDQRIELATAGVLLLTATASERKDELFLRLARDGMSEWIATQLSTGADPIEIDSLAPGAYRATIERLDDSSFTALAFADVTVSEGAAVEVALSLDPVTPAPGERSLFGSLRIPPEWGAIDFSIELARLEDSFVWIGRPLVTALEPNVWSWGAGRQDADRYMALVRPFMWSFMFDYDPKSASDFALVIPPPADVCIKLIDKRTGAPIDDEQLSWYGMPPPQPSSITGTRVSYVPSRGGYCFTAPIGDIVLNLSDAEQPIRFEPVHIAPGVNVIEVPFAPFVRVRVFAVQDGKRVPWPDSVYLSAVEQTAARHSQRTYNHTDWIDLGFDAPGKYVIRVDNFSALFGSEDENGVTYETVSAEVEAVRDRIVEIELPLKPVK
ncbi:MAG: hypothetical protein K8S98_00920 [Planctomycetes bacterium]|nr:hypothetical protein [Planctomycetota bacterium]